MSAIASMLFDGWMGLGRVLLVGTLAYAALVVILRVSGKRTLTKLNAFDLVVTVALGSTLATVLLSKDVALLEGILAMVVLIVLQYAITWASVRQPLVRRLVKSEPTLLVHRGIILDDALRRQRVTRDEVLSVLRSNGIAAVEDASAVVLETDGSFSIVKTDSEGHRSTLSDVPRRGPDSPARVDAPLSPP